VSTSKTRVADNDDGFVAIEIGETAGNLAHWNGDRVRNRGYRKLIGFTYIEQLDICAQFFRPSGAKVSGGQRFQLAPDSADSCLENECCRPLGVD